MIEGQIDVVQGIANFVCNRGGEASHNRSFFNLVKFGFELAGAAQSRRHIIERFRECAHLIATFGGNANIEVASSYSLGRNRQVLNRSCELQTNNPVISVVASKSKRV